MKVRGNVSRIAATAFAVAALLSVLAVYNLLVGVYGGAIVSSIGVVVSTLIGVLSA